MASLIDDVGVDAWHVGGSPREYIQIIGEELLEYDPLVEGEPRSDSESSFRM